MMAYVELDPELYSAILDEDFNYGYCVRNDDPAHAQHLWRGKKLLKHDFTDAMDAWLFLQEAGAALDGYSDRLNPIWLSTPTVLYRSLSLHELAEITETGVIRGSGNHWNFFEPRKLVFFSPQPTEACLWQGIEVDRLANVLAAKELPVDAIRTGKYDQDAFVARHRALMKELNEAFAEMTYTSAVIETKPVSNGLHYSREHGSTGMNGEDEFGFVPGFLKISDIATVHWVKDREMVASCSVDEVMDTLQEIGFAERFLPPRAASPSI